MRSTLTFLLYAYLLVASLFALKYNYQYARKEGFVSWLLLGEVFSTAKGLIWPYYEFIKDDKKALPKDHTLNHFKSSIEYVQNSFAKEEELSADKGIGSIAKEDMDKINMLKSLSLEEAQKVRLDDLIFINPNLPQHYKEEFIAGLDKYMQGEKSNNPELKNEGTLLVNKFGAWYRTIAQSN